MKVSLRMGSSLVWVVTAAILLAAPWIFRGSFSLTLLTQMLLILGLSTAMQYVVFGAAILVGMLVSGDRVAAILGRVLRPMDSGGTAHRAVGANTG